MSSMPEIKPPAKEIPAPKRRKISKMPGAAKDDSTAAADAATEGHLPTAVWSQVFLFENLKDIPEIACVSKEWNAALKVAKSNQQFWKSLFAAKCPRLARIVQDYYDSDTSASKQWKLMLKTRVASPYKPTYLNKDLQKDLETVFSPMGILAFSNCCSNCTGSYLEQDRDFPRRYKAFHPNCLRYRAGANADTVDAKNQDGLNFFKFFLSGANYHCTPTNAFVCYNSWESLDKHWESECKLADLWCAVLGLEKGDYTIEKPKDQMSCVAIHFNEPFQLEEERWSDEDDSEEDDMEDGEGDEENEGDASEGSDAEE